MVLIEFRIPLPLSCEEFHRGQLYMVAQQSLAVTEDDSAKDEGVQWLKNEPYDNTDGSLGVSTITGTKVPQNKGQYTLKRYLLKSKVPSIVAALAPSNALFLIEEAWNAYPHCKTVLVNGYFNKDKFKIEVETMHVDTDLDRENAVNLSAADLAQRKVEYLDIMDGHKDPAKQKEYDARYDCSKYVSKKTGRGPLSKGWERRAADLNMPVMCCYKVVRADFKYFGMQGKIESTIINAQRDLFARTLAVAFCTLDDWNDKTMAEIRDMEREVARRAESRLKGATDGLLASPMDDAVASASAATAPAAEGSSSS